MIKVPTVLVLGAGASMQFGFPSGLGLLQARESWRRSNPLGPLGYGTGDVNAFAEALYHSGHASVDAFLEQRPEFIPIGKAAISFFLVGNENSETLSEHNPGDSPNWYRHLLNNMVGTFDDFGKNQLAVITFNYERSFEHFLFTSLRHRFNKSSDETAKAIAHIPIVHVHGQIGRLTWQENDGTNLRPYEAVRTQESIRIAAAGIKIISEDMDSSPEFQQARRLLKLAERIFFFGFGYHPTNLKRLGLAKVLGQPFLAHGIISGTWQGMTLIERSWFTGKNGFVTFENLGPDAASIMGFMRNSAHFLSCFD